MRDCNVVYSDSSNSSFDNLGVEVSANGGTNGMKSVVYFLVHL